MSTAKPAALITGAAKGIGRAIARHLVALGWQVGIIDLADSGLRGAFAAMHSLSKPMCATRKPRPTRRRSDYSSLPPSRRGGLSNAGYGIRLIGETMKGIRQLRKVERSGDKIIAKQCPHCAKWFTTRLRSRILCLRCEIHERREGQSPGQ